MASSNITVPQCAAHVSAGAYSSQGLAKFDLTSWAYYKSYVTSAQVLAGVVIGVLCWVVAAVFCIWLLTLCCRSVGWRSRRTRVHDVQASGRNKWAVFNVMLFIVVLGVIGTCTWALVEGLKTTDGQVNEFWGIMTNAKTQLQTVSGTVQETSGSLEDMQASITATYTLINNNQGAASAAGVNVPATLSYLTDVGDSIASGLSGTQEAQSNIQGNGIVKVEDLQRNYQKKTEDAWKTYRVVAVAVFFGLLILFGVLAGGLALLDRTPRTTAAFTLLLLLWAGLVLVLGAGVLNLVWRVSRDGCLYGVDFAARKIGAGSNTQVVLNYYFQRTYIPPQDVSQRLFKFNLTSIADTLSDARIAALVSQSQSPLGQALVSTASASDQAAINALGSRVASLSANLTALNTRIQAEQFAGVSGGVQNLICCSTTNALWNLWLASVVTGAVGALAAILALVKVVTAIYPLGSNQHYTPHTPNGSVPGGKYSGKIAAA